MDSSSALARAARACCSGKNLFTSFLADGLLGGAGTVLAFMPQIVILTVALELLEASGYLARGAFLVDRLLRLLGLSGRSFLPLLMGHACAVPAIAATRIVRDPRERLTTILVLPLMTCSARLPTYGLVLATFFGAPLGAVPGRCIFVGLYFAGIMSALVASLVLRRTATRGQGPAARPRDAVVPRPAGARRRAQGGAGGAALPARRRHGHRRRRRPCSGCSSRCRCRARARAPGIERQRARADASVGHDRAGHATGRLRLAHQRRASSARSARARSWSARWASSSASRTPPTIPRRSTERLREAKKPDGTPVYSTAHGPRAARVLRPRLPVHEHGRRDQRETRPGAGPPSSLAYT